MPLGSRPSLASTEQAISFGPFRFEVERRLLFRDGQPVRIGGRALDILTLLVQRAEDLVTKDELVAHVWPGLTVDEGNLRAQVAQLRRVLGEGEQGVPYVSTVSGRGYRFVAEWMPVERPPARAPHRRCLPARLTRPVGRGEVVRELGERLLATRCVTIVGPGGIGKTTAALAAAEQMPGEVCFVDLAPLNDAALLNGAVLSALGRVQGEEAPTGGLDAVLAGFDGQRTLLILDNCEHVVEAAALLAEQVLRAAPEVRILATSREPLRAEGETVYRLPPLETPPPQPDLTAAEALAYPAIQLFVERAAAQRDGFVLTDGEAPLVAEICRCLDGMALAIELAAGQVDALGIQGVADRLDDRFRLLMRGRRTAMPRHQTLGAALDWSYDLLGEAERRTLRRLSVFAGRFDLEAARAVAGEGADLLDEVATLVSKSLVNADMRAARRAYSLLATTRAYGREKLAEQGEAEKMARRHALYLLHRFGDAEAEAGRLPPAEWGAICLDHVDDVRAALHWALSPGGDGALGVSLTIATLPLWHQLAFHDECHGHIRRALALLSPDMPDGDRLEMQLRAGLGLTANHSRTGDAAEVEWKRVLALAERLDDHDHRLRALWGLWTDRFSTGRFRLSVDAGARLRRAAAQAGSPDEALIGERLMGISHFYLGRLRAARHHLELALEQRTERYSYTDVLRYHYDQRIAARSLLAPILWSLGEPDRALREALVTVEEAEVRDHPMSLALALERACMVTLLTGQYGAAERYGVRLGVHARNHGLILWEAIADCFLAALMTAQGDARRGLPLLRQALGRFPRASFESRYVGWRGRLAEALSATGETEAALAVLDELLDGIDRTEERWFMPEFLGRRGEVLRAAGMDAAAEDTLHSALDWSRRQESLSWELRAATGLARLWRDRGLAEQAHALLASVHGRFREGFGTVDVQQAQALLDELAGPSAPRRAIVADTRR